MKITDIRATPVSIPLLRAGAMRHGPAAARVTRTIVEVVTDAGLVGLGETGAGVHDDILLSRFKPALLGLDPREVTTARLRCLPRELDFGTPGLRVDLQVFGGLELALWDLVGKSLSLPLFRMLGGPVRERAPFVSYAYPTDDVSARTRADDLVRFAVAAVERSGASLFEFKLGSGTGEEEVEVARAVREALPSGVEIAADANLGLTLDQARTFLRGTADIPLANFEEPVATLDGMERLSADFRVPVSTHCISLDALQRPHIEGFVASVDTVGGISGVRRWATMASAWGKRFWLRSFPETGVMWAAMAHLGMALPELDRPGQALIDIMEDDLVVGETWWVQQGGVRPPELPGLGVELDRAALERYHEQYLELGRHHDFVPDPTE